MKELLLKINRKIYKSSIDDSEFQLNFLDEMIDQPSNN